MSDVYVLAAEQPLAPYSAAVDRALDELENALEEELAVAVQGSPIDAYTALARLERIGELTSRISDLQAQLLDDRNVPGLHLLNALMRKDPDSQ
jgi:uncharacterized protein YggL (DUF469 family)